MYFVLRWCLDWSFHASLTMRSTFEALSNERGAQTTGAMALASWRETRRRFAVFFPPSGARDHLILGRSSVGRERSVAVGTASSAATLGQIRLATREQGRKHLEERLARELVKVRESGWAAYFRHYERLTRFVRVRVGHRASPEGVSGRLRP